MITERVKFFWFNNCDLVGDLEKGICREGNMLVLFLWIIIALLIGIFYYFYIKRRIK